MNINWTNLWVKQIINGTKKFSDVPEARQKDVEEKIRADFPEQKDLVLGTFEDE